MVARNDSSASGSALRRTITLRTSTRPVPRSTTRWTVVPSRRPMSSLNSNSCAICRRASSATASTLSTATATAGANPQRSHRPVSGEISDAAQLGQIMRVAGSWEVLTERYGRAGSLVPPG